MIPSYRSLRPLVPWQALARPVDWGRCFGREAPLFLEIGFGDGEFLVREAQRRPDRNHLGIERRWVRVRGALRRIARAGATNVRILHAPAELAVGWLLAPRSVAAAVALFPCPWPRRSQERERLFGERFALDLNGCLADDATAEVVTDDRAYAEWVLPRVERAGFEARLEVVAPRYDTKYERRWLARGREGFYSLSLRKRAHVERPIREEPTMEIHRVDRFDPARFAPEGMRGEFAIEFRDFLYDAERRRGMVRAIVAEEGLTQDFWIEIAARDGGWRVGPARGSWVLPTRGAARALDRVRAAALST